MIIKSAQLFVNKGIYMRSRLELRSRGTLSRYVGLRQRRRLQQLPQHCVELLLINNYVFHVGLSRLARI